MAKPAVHWLGRRIGAPGPYLTLCLSEDEMRRAMKRIGQSLPWLAAGKDACVHAFAGPGGLCCVVCLGDVTSRSGVEIAGLLVHEAVHVWQHWCDDIGEYKPGMEQEAYGVQAIAQALMAEYARRCV